MEFNFELKEESKANYFLLHLSFGGGDANNICTEEFCLHNGKVLIDATNYLEHLDYIKKVVTQYLLLQNILDINSDTYEKKYDEVLLKHGESIATLFDETPNDPTNDYQDKCYLDDIVFVKYDEQGNRYESNIIFN